MHPLSRYIAFVDVYVEFQSFAKIFDEITRFVDVVSFTIEKKKEDLVNISDSGSIYHHSYTYNNSYFSGLYVGKVESF